MKKDNCLRPNSYMHKTVQVFKLQKYTFLILLLGIGTVIPYVFLPQAYAYIDPGSGSAIIYILISAFDNIAEDRFCYKTPFSQIFKYTCIYFN